MATNNLTRQTDSSEYPAGFPAITIPKDFQEGNYGQLLFWIETPAGSVKVEGGWRLFECKGTAQELEAAGLLQADWLPGIPGNNKISQAVIFDESGPRLKRQSGGRNFKAPCIRIKRLSRVTYSVEIPPTQEQKAFMQEVIERNRNKPKQEKAEASASKKPQTPSGFRASCYVFVDALRAICAGSLSERSKFRFTKDAMVEIDQALLDLRNTLESSSIQASPQSQHDGNVIYLKFSA